MVNRAESFHTPKPPKKKKKARARASFGPFPTLGNNNYGAPDAVRNPVAAAAERNRYTGPLSGSMADRNPLDRFDTPAERAARLNYNANKDKPRIRNTSVNTPSNHRTPQEKAGGNIGGGSLGGRSGGGSGGGQNGTMGILDQVIQHMLNDSASSTFDYEHALQQSQKAIRQAYGAEIHAVRSNNGAATRETRRDRKQLEAMYDGLARSYGQAAHQAQVNANQGAAAQTALAKEANQTIKASQGANTREEANLIKGLGLQQATKDLIDPDFKEVTKVEAENTQTGARKAGVQKEFGGINRDFMVQGGLSSRMEGTNRSADLLTNLEDYVRQNRNQIAVLAGKRAQDLAQNRISTQSAAAQAQATSDQNQMDNLLKAIGLRGNLADTDTDNALAAAQFQDKQGVERQNFGLKAAQQRFDQGLDIRKLEQGQQKINLSAAKKNNSYLPKELQASMNIVHSEGQKQGKITSILQSLFNSQQFRDGSVSRFEGKGANQKKVSHRLTPAEAANMAEKAARKAGLSEHDVQVARMAAWASVK